MRSYLYFCFLFSFFFSLALFTFADPPNKNFLNLDELVKEAIEKNPGLASKRPEVEAASLAVRRVQTLDDPQFLFRALGNPIGCNNDFIKERRYKFDQKIPFPGKLRTKGEIARQDLAFMRSQEITTLQDLVLGIKTLYFNLYFNYVSIDIIKKTKKIVSKVIQDSISLYKTGKGSQADILKAQVELNKLDDHLIMLKSERVSLNAMINSVLNKPQGSFLGDPKELFHEHVKFDYNQLESISIRQRPELKGQEALVEKEESMAKLSKLNYYPDFNIEFMIQNRPEKHQNAWGINFGFNIPIWISRKQKHEKQEAEARAMANRFTLQNMRSIIRGRIKSILAQLDFLDARIELYKISIIPKTYKTLSSNKADYRVGKGDFINLLDTVRQIYDEELKYEQALVDREIVLAKLEKEVGIPLKEIINLTKISKKERLCAAKI